MNMSGKYSCEVTTDAPDFTTDLKTEHLNVIGKFENGRGMVIITWLKFKVLEQLFPTTLGRLKANFRPEFKCLYVLVHTYK